MRIVLVTVLILRSYSKHDFNEQLSGVQKGYKGMGWTLWACQMVIKPKKVLVFSRLVCPVVLSIGHFKLALAIGDADRDRVWRYLTLLSVNIYSLNLSCRLQNNLSQNSVHHT